MSADHHVPTASGSPDSVISRNSDYGGVPVGHVSFGSGLTATTNDETIVPSASDLLYENYYHKFLINEAYNREMAQSLKISDTERARTEVRLIQMRDDYDAKIASMTKTIEQHVTEIDRLKQLHMSTAEQVKIAEEQKAEFENERNAYQNQAKSEIASLTKTIEEQAAEISGLKDMCDYKTMKAMELRDLCDAQAKDAEQQKAELEQLIAKERKAYQDKAEEAQRDIEGVSGFVENLKLKIAALTEEKENMAKEHQTVMENVEKKLASVVAERDFFMKKAQEFEQHQSKKYQAADTERSIQAYNVIESLKKNVSTLTSEKEDLKHEVKFLTEHCGKIELNICKANEMAERANADRVYAETKYNELESKYNKLLSDRFPVSKIGDSNDRRIKERHASATRAPSPSVPSHRFQRTGSPAVSPRRTGIRMGLSPIDRKLLKPPCPSYSRHPNTSHFTGGVLTVSPKNFRDLIRIDRDFESTLRLPADNSSFEPKMSSTPRPSR
uniref:SWI5-dependent HO expression protein 3 n=1 Tax=Panagrellus redivivus TaxID=6233 RepID=A0A7E4W3I2_PANRE